MWVLHQAHLSQSDLCNRNSRSCSVAHDANRKTLEDVGTLVCIGEYTGNLLTSPSRQRKKSTYKHLFEIGNRRHIDGEQCPLRHVEYANALQAPAPGCHHARVPAMLWPLCVFSCLRSACGCPCGCPCGCVYLRCGKGAKHSCCNCKAEHATLRLWCGGDKNAKGQ